MASAQSWDVAGNWSPPSNPNTPWSYGELSSGSFVLGTWAAGTSTYDVSGNALVGRNTSASTVNEIMPGDVYMIAGTQVPAINFTAPNAGKYDISVNIGGPIGSILRPQGNLFAPNAKLSIGGVLQTGSYSATTNVFSWSLSKVSLSKNEIVEAYISDAGSPGADTDTRISINAVPEPAPFAVVGVCLLGMLLKRKK